MLLIELSCQKIVFIIFYVQSESTLSAGVTNVSVTNTFGNIALDSKST